MSDAACKIPASTASAALPLTRLRCVGVPFGAPTRPRPKMRDRRRFFDFLGWFVSVGVSDDVVACCRLLAITGVCMPHFTSVRRLCMFGLRVGVDNCPSGSTAIPTVFAAISVFEGGKDSEGECCSLLAMPVCPSG